MVVLEAQGGAVLGIAWPLPFGSASGPLRKLNEHYSSHTLRHRQLKGRDHTTCTPILMSLMWLRCCILARTHARTHAHTLTLQPF